MKEKPVEKKGKKRRRGKNEHEREKKEREKGVRKWNGKKEGRKRYAPRRLVSFIWYAQALSFYCTLLYEKKGAGWKGSRQLGSQRRNWGLEGDYPGQYMG